MTNKINQKEDLLECPVCGAYLKRNEGFRCPKCKRGPFCRTHRIPGERMCPGCLLEIKSKEISVLKGQEKSLKGFSLFLQFIFIIFTIFYISNKLGLGEFMQLLMIDIIAEYSLYIGLLALLGSLIFYLIVRSQRSMLLELEAKVKKIRLGR